MKQLWYNTARKYRPVKRYERNTQPSQTIHGESYSIKQIMERALAGQQPEYVDVEFFDEEDLDRIDAFFAPGQLDLTDLDTAKNRIAEMHHIVEKALEKKAEAEKQETEEEPPEEEKEDK